MTGIYYMTEPPSKATTPTAPTTYPRSLSAVFIRFVFSQAFSTPSLVELAGRSAFSMELADRMVSSMEQRDSCAKRWNENIIAKARRVIMTSSV